MGDDLVAHEAAIDIGKLPVGARTGGVGYAGQPPDPQALQAAGGGRFAGHVIGRPVDHHGLGREVFAQHIGQPSAQRVQVTFTAGQVGRDGAPLRHQLAFVPDGEPDIGTAQGVASHRLDAMGQLGAFRLEELAPCRCGKEQLAHLDGGAAASRGRLQLATAAVEQPAMTGGVFIGAREYRHLGDGTDRRQRFATEPHGVHRLQVVQAGDLAGGVALEGGGQLLAQDAAAIVLDADQADATGLQSHRDLSSARVQGVVQQFTYHRGRSLDHLAGGNLADQLIRQFADRTSGGGQGGVHAAIVGRVRRCTVSVRPASSGPEAGSGRSN